MLKIGVVGAGIISNSHINAIKSNDECCLVAITDIVLDRAKELAEKNNVSYYTDYKEMCKSEKLNAVILNLPHYLHCEVSVYFLNKGIHVLVEKPMANTVEECDKMIDAAKKNNVKLAVGHIQRFFSSTIKVKEIIENETYGKLCMITEVRNIFYFNENRPKWFLSKEKAGGGIVMNYMAHTLDKIFYLIGNKVTQVSSNCANFLDGYTVEGNAQILLKLENHLSANITFCGYNIPGFHETAYYFSNGVVKVTDENSIWVSQNNEFVKVELSENIRPFQNQLAEFLKLTNDKPSNIVKAQYAKEIIEVIEKIYEVGN